MIATMDFMENGRNIFHYEFPLESPHYVVGLSWAEGIKAGIDEFRVQFPDRSLFGIVLLFGNRE